MSGPGGVVSMVKASPTSQMSAMQNQGSPCRHALVLREQQPRKSAVEACRQQPSLGNS